MTGLGWAILVYVGVQLAIGLWVSRRVRTEDDFLVAGRRLGTWPVAASVFATWFGAETCISAAGQIHAEGLTRVSVEPFGYGLCLVVMGLTLARPLWRRGITTIADLLRERFGVVTERLAAVITIPTSILWAAAQIRAFGEILAASTGMEVSTTIAWAALIAIVYTSFGGLLADVVTDVVQGAVLVLGLVVLLGFVMVDAGGVVAFAQRVGDAPLHVFDRSGPGFFETFETWTLVIVGSLIAQEVVARTLAAKSADVARRGAVMGGIAYLVIGSIPVLLALGAGAGPGAVPVAEAAVGGESTDAFLPDLARTHLPAWLYVVFAGALVSAILSTVDSALLAAGAIAARNLLPRTNEATRLRTARLGVIVSGGIAWYLATESESVFELVQESSGFASAGVVVVLVLGLWSKVGGRFAGMSGLIAGAVVWCVGAYGDFGVTLPFTTSLVAAILGFAFGALLDQRGARARGVMLGLLGLPWLMAGCGSGALPGSGPPQNTASPAAEVAPMRAPFCVRGRVVAAEGAASADASVELFAHETSGGSSRVAGVRSDAAGHFELCCDRPTSHAIELRISHPLHAGVVAIAPNAGLPAVIEVGSVTLPLGVATTLRLHDLDESPLPGLLVSAEFVPSAPPREAAPGDVASPLHFVIGPTAAGWTDTNGVMRLVCCEGRWTVRWGGGSSSSQFEIPEGVREFERALLARGVDPSALIDGHVVEVDAADTTIGGASFVLHAGAIEHRVVADAGGRFSLQVRTRDVGARFAPSLDAGFGLRFRLVDGDQSFAAGDRGVQLRLRRRETVRTRLRFDLPAGAPNDAISLHAAWALETAPGVLVDGPAPSLEAVPIGADGTAILPPAPRDPLALWLIFDGPADSPALPRLVILRGTPTDAATRDVVLSDVRPHVVRVLDSDSGTGIAGLDVWLQHGKPGVDPTALPMSLRAIVAAGRVATPVCVARARTDEAGRAILMVPREVAPLVLGVSGPTIAPTFEPFRPGDETEPDNQTSLRLPRYAAVRGRVAPLDALRAFVTHDHPRALLRDAQLVAAPPDDRAGRSRRIVAAIGDDGTFAFDGLPAEPWVVSIEVSPPGPAAARGNPPLFELAEWRDLRSGSVHEQDLDITPLTPGDVVGRMLCDGQPLEATRDAAIVVLTRPDGTMFNAEVASDGSFLHDDVPAGRYRALVVFEHAGELYRHVHPSPIEVVAWQRVSLPIELRSRPLLLRLLDATGRPLPHHRVRTVPAGAPLADPEADQLRALHVERPPLTSDESGELALRFPPEAAFVLVDAEDSGEQGVFAPVIEVGDVDVRSRLDLRRGTTRR